MASVVATGPALVVAVVVVGVVAPLGSSPWMVSSRMLHVVRQSTWHRNGGNGGNGGTGGNGKHRPDEILQIRFLMCFLGGGVVWDGMLQIPFVF